MTDERAFFQRLDDSAPKLSRRVQAALAAAAAERGLASLRASGGLSLGDLERAVELTWSYALGEDVPFDLHREVRHRVAELRWETAYDVLATEDALGRAIEDAIDILDPTSCRDAVAWCVEHAIDGDAARDEALAWASAALERALSIDDAELHRTTFGAPDADADARRARVAAWREAHVVVPWREPSGIPRRYVVLEVGRAPPSSQGTLSVSGQLMYGFFTRDDDRPGFSVPDAVAYGMTPDERTLYVWRKVKRAGRSGAARPDYDWYVERHNWPERTFDARHVVQDREGIDWCLPVRLDVPVEGNGRIATLRCAGEDFARDIFVVDMPDGTRETTDRREAVRWAVESWPAQVSPEKA